MESLRKILGIPERYERVSIMLLLGLLFLLIFALLRGCVGGFSAPRYEAINVVPSANTPIVRSDLGDDNVQFTGTAGPNQRVDVFVDGKIVGTATADRIGQWYLEGAVETEGRHELSLKARQADGTLYTGPAIPFEIDFRAATDGQSLAASGSSVDYLVRRGEVAQAAPEAELVTPTILTTLDGQTVNAGAYTIRGTGTPGRNLLVFANGAVVGLALADANGNWSIDTNLDAGTSYTFRAEDATVNGFETASYSVNTPLGIARPTLDIVRDERRNIIPLVGTGEPNSMLQITQNGVAIGMVDVDASGNWSLDVERDAGINDYTFVANALDADEAVLASSLPGRLVLSAVSAPDPVVEEEEEMASAEISLNTPAITLNDLTFENGVANGTLPLGGDAAPNGARVLLSLEGEPLGETSVTNSGTYILDAGIANLEPGRYEVVAQIVDDAGTELASDSGFIVIPGAPAVELTQPSINLGDVSIDDDGNAGGVLPVEGTAAPVGGTVRLYLDGEFVGDAIVNSDGTYSLPLDWSLAPGTYQLTADIVEDADSPILATSNTVELVIPEIETTLQVVYASLSDSDAAATRLQEDAPTVALIFDASWSMTLPPDSDAEADRLTADDPGSRIAIARNSLLEVVETLPEGVPVALRAFGVDVPELGCETDLLVPLGPLDRDALSAEINGIEPSFNANTHIAASLDAIPGDLADAEGAVTVILLTDGQENCGGNPAASIANLRSQGFNVVVDVVGFAVSTDALRGQFESWAEIGGGDYYDASDADGLATALDLAFRPKYRVLDADGSEVAVGAVGSDKITLPAGNYTVEMLTADGDSYEVVVGPFATVLQVD